MFKRRRVDTIGSAELVNFPKLGIFGVPAKIDTGADSSSIWATSIEVSEGELCFKLFGPGSRFYSGKVIKTKKFRTTSIKNSFGHTEFRYKVNLVIAIGERNINAWFTLSNRLGMTYPVLIGRRLLQNKFVVDVSKHKVHGGKNSVQKILVLSSKPKNLADFFDNVAAQMEEPAEFYIRRYSDLAFVVKTGKVKVFDTQSNLDLNEFDLVYFKSHHANYPLAMAVVQYLKYHNTRVFDREVLEHVAYDKLSEYMRLALNNISVPVTYCGSAKYLSSELTNIAEKLGYPFVCKEIMADRGNKNFLINKKSDVLKVLKHSEKSDVFLMQKFIPSKGYLRAFVFGRKVAVAVHRSPVKNTDSLKAHLNNPFGSSNATLVGEDYLSPLAADLAIRSAEVMKRQIAGVDLIQNTKTKKWFVLEVNSAPQIRSGSFVEIKEREMAKYIDSELKR